MWAVCASVKVCVIKLSTFVTRRVIQSLSTGVSNERYETIVVFMLVFIISFFFFFNNFYYFYILHLMLWFLLCHSSNTLPPMLNRALHQLRGIMHQSRNLHFIIDILKCDMIHHFFIKKFPSLILSVRICIFHIHPHTYSFFCSFILLFFVLALVTHSFSLFKFVSTLLLYVFWSNIVTHVWILIVQLYVSELY